MRCIYTKDDGQRCKRSASKGQAYCWDHARKVKADPTLAKALGPGPRPETKESATLANQAVELEAQADEWLQNAELESQVVEPEEPQAVEPEEPQAVGLEAQVVEPKAHPKTSQSAPWHFASLGGPEGLGVVEYGLPECKDEKLVDEILATPYLQLISCLANGTILNRFMARPCAAKHHENWRMGLPGLSSRFPENHFDVGILVGPQPGDVVEAMERLVKGPIIRV